MNKTILLSVLIFSLLFATLVYSLGTYTLLVSVYEYGTANELVANITVFNSTDDWSCINCNRYPWAVSLYSGAYTLETTSQGYLPDTRNIEISDRDMGLNIYLKVASPDTEAPQWSNLKEFPLGPTDYSEGQTYWFNITWTDNVAVDNVILQFDGVNYSVNNEGDEYYKTFSNLDVGLYLYTWYANDTSDNWNSIDSNYTINQKDPINQTEPSESLIHLALNDQENDLTITYETESNATGWKEFTEGELILYRNGIEVDRGQIANEITKLPANNIYNYTLHFPETANYKAASVVRFLTVEKADPYDPSDPQNSILHLAINGIEDDVTIVNGTESNATGWVEQGDAGAVTKLFRNGGEVVVIPDIQTLPEGTYVYNFTYDETENYTAGFVTRTLTVTSVIPEAKPDLEVTTSDILITPSVQPGDYEIEITIHNIGNETATNVYYEVYDNSVLIESNTLSSVINGSFETRTFLWLGPSAGLHTIELRVDPNDNIDEWDESNNIASRDITISGDDTEAPQCSNFVANPEFPIYAPGQSYQFNCTWTDNVQVDTVIFELSGTNYSASNDGDVYYIIFTDLPADVYYATWYANDTSDNWNVTSTMVYDIMQAPTTISLYLNGTEFNKNYLHNEFANFTVALDVSGKTVNLDTNMTDWILQSGITPLEVITNLTEKGYFNVTGYFEGDQNYTAASKTLYISVNGGDITPPLITILSPENITYDIRDIDLNYTVDEPTDWVGYSLDSNANVTIPGNTTLTSLASGEHYLVLYGNDTSGNMGFDDVYFTIMCLSHLVNSYVDGTLYTDEYQNIHDLSNVVCSELYSTNVTVSNITDSYLNISLIDNSEIYNATVQNCSIADSTFEGECTDTFIDPSDIRRSNTTGSVIKDSHIWDSNATFSNITISWLDFCDVTNSTLYNVTCYNSTIFNSTIFNSNIINMTVRNANITDDYMDEGEIIYDGVNYTTPTNLTELYKGTDLIPPVIVSIAIDPAQPFPGETILVNVTATDNVAVANVTVNDSLATWVGDNLWQISLIVPTEDGTYSIPIVATDYSGNSATRYLGLIINNSDTPPVIVDLELPVVGEIYPRKTQVGIVEPFYVNVSDDTLVKNCSLFVDGQDDGEMTDDLPSNNTTVVKGHEFTSQGHYILIAGCYDIFENYALGISTEVEVVPVPVDGSPGSGSPPREEIPSPLLKIELTAPSSVNITPGETGSFAATVKNVGQSFVNDLTLTVSGVPESWTRVSPDIVGMLDINDSYQFTVEISVPDNHTEDSRSLILRADAKQIGVNATDTTTLTIFFASMVPPIGDGEGITGMFIGIITDAGVIVGIVIIVLAGTLIWMYYKRRDKFDLLVGFFKTKFGKMGVFFKSIPSKLSFKKAEAKPEEPKVEESKEVKEEPKPEEKPEETKEAEIKDEDEEHSFSVTYE